jgi:TonB family protein
MRHSQRICTLFFFFLTATNCVATQKENVQRGNEGIEDLCDFYVVRLATSDASPFWFDYILDVKPQGRDLLVRYIRMAPVNGLCPGIVKVMAAQRAVRNTTVGQIAGKVDLCALKQGDVAERIQRLQRRGISTIFDSARFGVVAHCGSTERLFELPYPEQVDFDRIAKRDPTIASLWNLYSDVLMQIFGEDKIFYDISATRDAELQRFGATFVPELRSGVFDRGFRGDSVNSLLDHYYGVIPVGDPAKVALLNSEALHLVEYSLPTYPILAKLARIQGRVDLEISTNFRTGSVDEVKAISGHGLLQKAAIDSVRQWRFAPASAVNQPVRAVIEFAIRCPTP